MLNQILGYLFDKTWFASKPPVPGTISVPIDTIMSGKPFHLDHDDPHLIQHILSQRILFPPSTKPYNLSFPEIPDPSVGQGEIIRKLLKNQRNGFFIEAGALDGERHSNTLFLEKNLGWNGLLVEPSPKNWKLLMKKNRKCWKAFCCLATKPYPHQVCFEEKFNISQIVEEDLEKIKEKGETREDYVVCQCYPLYSILKAMGVDRVDYFSLDVEGVENEILQHFPFDKIFVKAISVEFSHNDKDWLRQQLEGKGFVLVTSYIQPDPEYAHDYIFIHKTYKHLVPNNVEDILPDFVKT